MEDGVGYWINMEESATLTVYGFEFKLGPAPPPTYIVKTGWNLIGFKSLTSRSTPDYLSTLGNNCKRVYYFDGVSLVSVFEGTMWPGFGYWIYVTADGVIAP